MQIRYRHRWRDPISLQESSQKAILQELTFYCMCVLPIIVIRHCNRNTSIPCNCFNVVDNGKLGRVLILHVIYILKWNLIRALRHVNSFYCYLQILIQLWRMLNMSRTWPLWTIQTPNYDFNCLNNCKCYVLSFLTWHLPNT